LHQYHIILSSAFSLTFSISCLTKIWCGKSNILWRFIVGQLQGKNTLNFLTHKSHFKLSQRYLTFRLLYLTGAFFVSSFISIFVSSLNVWTMQPVCPDSPWNQTRAATLGNKNRNQRRARTGRTGKLACRKNQPREEKNSAWDGDVQLMEESRHGKNRPHGNKKNIAALVWSQAPAGLCTGIRILGAIGVVGYWIILSTKSIH
jgi:hypothetical protein